MENSPLVASVRCLADIRQVMVLQEVETRFAGVGPVAARWRRCQRAKHLDSGFERTSGD